MARSSTIAIPDSKLAREATQLVRDTETELLFNHSSRVYLFGALTGERQSALGAIERKYKLDVDGHVALIEYQIKDGVLTILHTRVPPELGSRGIGTQLAEAALKDLRARGEAIQIVCPFVRGMVL
jgi:predicted GNAT family acetyltransferase